MKKIIFYLVFIFLIIHDLRGQTLALNTSKGKQEFKAYSTANFIAYRDRPGPPNALMIIGGSSIGIGIGIAFYGLLVQYDSYNATNETTDQSEWQKGNRAVFAGCAIAIAGIGMCIAGGIQHHRKYHHSRWGITTPKKNEIGFAYNF